ncbi:MAG: OB-fold domain-containing protein [Pseudomonadales bacterium]|nr:OB-fold domain-containing protein [Pseudomonadales bacterium]
MSEAQAITPPIVAYLKRDGERPYLSGSRCEACGHTFVGERTVCARCSVRDRMTPVRLAEKGRVYVATIVYRSFPGVDTPFVDVIVDLEDGAHLKGTLVGVEPDPAKLPVDLPVRIVYREASPPNRPGEKYLTYVFEPDLHSEGDQR